MGYALAEVTTETDWTDYHSIRRSVLWEARGLSGYNAHHGDEYLPANHPLLLKLDERSIGTTRVDELGHGTGAVRLVAIAADLQRRGHGRVLSEMVEAYARRLGIKTMFVNAAGEAVGYYEKMGWEHYAWNPAELTAIASDCVQMRKVLS
jgi:N-acetylglutamate synthase-like GNAT family acetyltransferase